MRGDNTKTIKKHAALWQKRSWLPRISGNEYRSVGTGSVFFIVKLFYTAR